MTAQLNRRLLNVVEAAAYLGMSPKTLYNLASSRRVAFVKIGRSLRFDVRDLDAVIEANRRPASLASPLVTRPHGDCLKEGTNDKQDI